MSLRLAWVTIHKSLGLTLDRIKVGPGKACGKEFSTGLTFVALSWVKTSNGIMIIDRLDFREFRSLVENTFSTILMITPLRNP